MIDYNPNTNTAKAVIYKQGTLIPVAELEVSVRSIKKQLTLSNGQEISVYHVTWKGEDYCLTHQLVSHKWNGSFGAESVIAVLIPATEYANFQHEVEYEEPLIILVHYKESETSDFLRVTEEEWNKFVQKEEQLDEAVILDWKNIAKADIKMTAYSVEECPHLSQDELFSILRGE